MDEPQKPTLLITGGRDFADEVAMREWVYEACDKLADIAIALGLRAVNTNTLQWVRMVHGAARGADTIAGLIGAQCDMEVIACPADWSRHPRAAGPIRNTQMLIQYKPHLLLAAPGGTGTNDMVTKAVRFGVPLLDKRLARHRARL